MEDLAQLRQLVEEPVSDEQRQFNALSHDKKLARFNTLVQKSQVYSQIMLENILENTLNKKQQRADPEPEKKKQRRGKGTKKEGDVLAMLGQASQLTKDTRNAIEQSQTNHTQAQPRLISGGTMKDYQLDGLEWLTTLYENGLNGILADEMGLGKTLQCIAFIAFLIEHGITGPFLVVAPLSTVSNWINEFARFAPSVKTVKYVGSKGARASLTKLGSYNVVVTSYEVLIRDFAKLNRVKDWKFLIVDEGHRLKNFECLLIKMLKKLNVTNRLLITGTPLQNNLSELWSLLNFILPDIFHDLELFEQWFNFSELKNLSQEQTNEDDKRLIELNIQELLVHNLHTILKPFILRRLKKDVMKDIPPKKEYLIHIPMSNLQKKLYNDALNRNLVKGLVEVFLKEYVLHNHPDKFTKEDMPVVDSYLELLGTITVSKRQREVESYEELDELVGLLVGDSDPESEPEVVEIDDEADDTQLGILRGAYLRVFREIKNLAMRNSLMLMRLICESPYIYYEPFFDHTNDTNTQFMRLLERNSPKFVVLGQLLDNLLPFGHRVLIFSQFNKMLDLVQDWLDYNDIGMCRLDGSTSQEEREVMIKEFNPAKSKKKVFLLSTRAGGLGINLVGADTVIILDNDWNPQMDLQAIDRVHRIGQTKPVKVFRFVMKHSIEEMLISKSADKRFLEKLVIQMGEFRFSKMKKIIDTNDFSSIRSLLHETQQVLVSRDHKDRDVTGDFLDQEEVTYITDEEMVELTLRDPQCYASTRNDFENITVFESVNNMEKAEKSMEEKKPTNPHK